MVEARPPVESRSYVLPVAEPSSGRRAESHFDAGPVILGDDPTLRQAVDLAATVAPARATVLIVGEQGTGKTLIARSIHQQSGRRDQPFLEVSCTGIDELGLERELFGQKFEGSESSERPGRLARAHRGTILLDEVSGVHASHSVEAAPALLDGGESEPLGSSYPIPVDVRFVLATRENLPALVEQGKFRRDLYERINGICLKLPPLRQRGHDVVRLAEHFRDRFAREYGKPVVGFSTDALDLLVRYEWPGNVRELESVIRAAAWLLELGFRVTAANLAVGMTLNRASSRPDLPIRRSPHLPHRPRTSTAQGSARGAGEADHHPGTPGPQLEPPGDGPSSTSTGPRSTRR